MTARRTFLIGGGAGLCALAATPFSFAQQPAKTRRIGFLGTGTAAGMASWVEALRAGLRELGYVEGRNIAIDYRWADGKYERAPGLAAELVRLNVEVLVTHGTPGTRAAKGATTTIPIVMAIAGDAVLVGLVANLARPGGNVTGSTFFNPELAAKRLELLKETLPRITRIAALVNPDNPAMGPVREAMEPAAKALKLELQQIEVRSAGEIENTFSEMAAKHIGGVVIVEDGMINANTAAIAGLGARMRLPLIGITEIAQAGGLLAYGVNYPEMYRRAAVFVDKILKGAKAGDLPIERASRFETIVNLKAAKALGITVPQSTLVRADRVIE